MSADEEKLKVLGKLQSDASVANMRVMSEEMQIPYSRILKYRKELEQATEDGEIASLVNVDKLIVHRVAEGVKQDLEELAEGELLSAEIDKTVEGIDGLNVLGERLQLTALTLANKINNLADTAVDSKDILILVESLSKIQMAFFNKAVTNVNVLNQANTYGDKKVSAFQGIQKR